MNITTDYAKNLEAAREAAEKAKLKAEATKAASQKEKAEAEAADKAVTTANENLTSQQNIYTNANTKVTSKQEEYNNALAYLNSLSGTEDENAISQAQAQVDRLLEELRQVKEAAKQEYDKLVRAQQDAQTAVKRAEIEHKEAEESLKELEEAEAELEQAQAELKEAEEAYEASKVSLENEVSQLTEEEAIEQGYTIIKTPDDLKAMANNLSGKYILMNDIDLAGIEWEPIGHLDPDADNPWETAFSGVLNGNGFSIKNLTVKDDGTSDAVGLFGVTNGAEIKDVILENIDVSAPNEYNETAVGGLIGISRDTNIDNVTVTGSVSGHQNIGGLIGKEMDSSNFGKVTISNVNANVDVNGSFYSGGLIGYVNSTAQNSLVLENCHTSGDINITDSSAGGLIGEAGKTVITVNNCSSSMNISKTGEEDTGLSWLLDDTSRIGGIIGNCNGTFISICNSNFTGTLNCDDEFKGENYGWYMNDAQVSIFELQAGLAVDDILKIDGVDAITPVIDPNTGAAHYDITVSTLAGMNRIVDMIQNNPKLAEIITFNIQFDFETMDEQYDSSGYSQYGVVQHIYEDNEGNVYNDVYIDNEMDLESTFNVGGFAEVEIIPGPKETMVKGLFKDDNGKYYILTPGTTNGKFENFTEVTLEFFFENQHTIVNKRLDSDEVRLRDRMTGIVYGYQEKIQNILKERYGWDENKPIPTIQEPEYKALKKKQMSGAALTPEEELKIATFELNYTIANIVGDITKNEGCGMGGNASFLDKNKGIVLEDEWGRERWMLEDGTELRQKVDENGELMVDEDGKPVFETLEGEPFDGDADSAYKVRGFAVTDEDGNALYSDKEGKTVVETKAEDGTVTYAYEDGTVYEGEQEDLTQQIEEYSPQDMVDDLEGEMDNLLDLYENGGAVDPSKENNGIPKKEEKEE